MSWVRAPHSTQWTPFWRPIFVFRHVLAHLCLIWDEVFMSKLLISHSKIINSYWVSLKTKETSQGDIVGCWALRSGSYLASLERSAPSACTSPTLYSLGRSAPSACTSPTFSLPRRDRFLIGMCTSLQWCFQLPFWAEGRPTLTRQSLEGHPPLALGMYGKDRCGSRYRLRAASTLL